MKNNVLFYNVESEEPETSVSLEDFRKSLRYAKADQCDILYIHTDISAFGIPNRKYRKRELLRLIHQSILDLGVGTVVYPSFTFSFANDESFDVNNSSAKSMGALNEYVRKLPDSVRSLDPLMSVVAVGEKAEMFYRVGKSAMNKEGAFSLLRSNDKVKFLFLGADPTRCFTYAHYVEAVLGVPYRFEKWYEGEIVDKRGHRYIDRYALHAACRGVYPAPMMAFKEQLIKNKAYCEVPLGSGKLVSFNERDAFQAVKEAINENINCFLAKPFKDHDLVHEVKKYDQRIVSVP